MLEWNVVIHKQKHEGKYDEKHWRQKLPYRRLLGTVGTNPSPNVEEEMQPQVNTIERVIIDALNMSRLGLAALIDEAPRSEGSSLTNPAVQWSQRPQTATWQMEAPTDHITRAPALHHTCHRAPLKGDPLSSRCMPFSSCCFDQAGSSCAPDSG